MIISVDNLKAGLRWWKENNFPSDLLNKEYYEIYEARGDGVTEEWWSATVDRLGRWRAYRGRTPPNTKADILSRGRDVLNELSRQYEWLTQRKNEPSITSVPWEDVQPLFTLARSVKPSPVFAGKMCHFLFPKLFIVMDNLATQVFDYEFYWRGMKDEWERFPEKETASENLLREIQSHRPVHEYYPVETKVMELSHIGYKHG